MVNLQTMRGALISKKVGDQQGSAKFEGNLIGAILYCGWVLGDDVAFSM